MTGSIFERLDDFACIHHMALNEPPLFRRYEERLGEAPDRIHVAEGDVCWAVGPDGRPLFYFRHPVAVFDRLGPDGVLAQRAAGRLLTLDDVLAQDTPGRLYVFELKIGTGALDMVMETLIARLEATVSRRYWIDAFSIPLLRMVKSIDPSVSTSLHTELALPRHLLHTSPQPLEFGLRSYDQLPYADGVAIRYHLGQHLTARACEGVRKAGKHLIMSRISTTERFDFAHRQNACGIYIDDFALVSRHGAPGHSGPTDQ